MTLQVGQIQPTISWPAPASIPYGATLSAALDTKSLNAGAVAGISGCGTSTGYFGLPQQTYTLSVNGTSGNLAHSTTVTVQ